MTLSKSVTANVVVGGIVGGFMALIGGFDALFQALAILMVLDLITGIAAAWKEGKLNSYKGWTGTIRKVVTLLIVVLAVQLDKVGGTGGAIRSAVLLYFIANEGLSMLENAARLGIPMPGILINALELLKDKGNGEQERGDV